MKGVELTRWCGKDATIRLDHGQELVVAVELQVGHIGGRPAVDDELVEHLELFPFFHLVPPRAVTIYRAGESHAEVDAHSFVAHDAVEMRLVSLKLKICQETETSQAEGQNGRDDALEKPRCEEDCAVSTQSQDQIKLLGLAPAEIRRPVSEHVLEAGVLVENGLGAKSFRVLELGIDIDIDSHIGTIARRLKEPDGELASKHDQLVVPSLGDNHDILDSAFDGPALELLGYLPDTGGSLHEARVRHPLVVLDLLEDLIDVDSIVEAVMVEAWRLQRGKSGGGCGI